MATQDTNRRDDTAEPVKLHSHRDLADDGAPRMTRAMEAYITASSSMSGRPADGEDSPLADLDEGQKAAALVRLKEEHARLYGVLFLTDLRGLSLRETGRYLGLDHKTVKRHRAKGMAHMRAWCQDERQAG